MSMDRNATSSIRDPLPRCAGQPDPPERTGLLDGVCELLAAEQFTTFPIGKSQRLFGARAGGQKHAVVHLSRGTPATCPIRGLGCRWVIPGKAKSGRDASGLPNSDGMDAALATVTAAYALRGSFA